MEYGNVSMPGVPLYEYKLSVASRVLLSKTKAEDPSTLIVLVVNRRLHQDDR